MRRSAANRAFTLVEVLLSMLTVGMLGAALVLFSSTSSRFIARNLATNHSHEATRISEQTLLKEARDAASSFRLFNYDGASYTDVTPTATSDKDVLSGKYAGTRANGVRFRQLFAGPVNMTASTTPTSTTMTFAFPASAQKPEPGDKVALPLISAEYDITAVSGGGTSWTVTVSPAVGYTLSVDTPNVVTGYFYRRAAFCVYKNELRYISDFNFNKATTSRLVRGGVTSPKPFALLFDSASSPTSDGLSVRVSMELTDLDYSARKWGNGTTTLYTVIPARNQPTVLSSTN